MKQYPDLLNNPDGDPRIYQRQYEDWYREQAEMDFLIKEKQIRQILAQIQSDRSCP